MKTPRSKEKERITLEIWQGLGVAEEADGGIGVGDGTEEGEDGAEASEAEEGEVGAGVSEASAQGESDLPIQPLPLQRPHQLCNCRRTWRFQAFFLLPIPTPQPFLLLLLLLLSLHCPLPLSLSL